MFIHAVYFWLREGLAAADRERFVAGLRSLRAIEGATEGFIGVPAPTDRPVIDRSYSWSLVLVFPSQREHDAYQVHPVHDKFRAECSGYWTTVRIYDSVTADGANAAR
ncbi:MAG: Dabb family protein [Gemmatimonadaceae bacterium]